MTSSLWADLEGTEAICPSGGSNSPVVGAQNLTQFGEKGKELRSNSIHPYVGQYRDVLWWRVSDMHISLAKRTIKSALHNF
jgi:hypothetical protein